MRTAIRYCKEIDLAQSVLFIEKPLLFGLALICCHIVLLCRDETAIFVTTAVTTSLHFFTIS